VALDLDPEELRQRLAQPGAEPAPGGEPERPGDLPAAVLAPLFRSPAGAPAGWYLLLTRRTDALSTHGGEIAFPGGRVEPGEASLEAALRETSEELSIDPASVTVLGALPPVETRVSRYRVTPWVGVLAPGAREQVRPNPAEVAGVIDLPLDQLAEARARREQRFIRGAALIVSPAYDAGGVTIWGATARMVSDLLGRLPGIR
jgi:8-oxo-dGTP pyrophosphatase MutT (NUDIX family)